jgi:hypothetical protein
MLRRTPVLSRPVTCAGSIAAFISSVYVQGLYLLNRAYGASYDALKVSVTLEGQAYPVTKYTVRKHVRTYRIGDHNQVYREVEGTWRANTMSPTMR